MNIGEIKRFVNDGLVPVNRLIGSPSDTENNNTIYGLQKKILTNIGDVKDGIAEVKEIVSASNQPENKIYRAPLNSSADELAACGKIYEESLPTISFSPTYLDGVFKFYNNFVPEYDGVVTLCAHLNSFYFTGSADGSIIRANTYLINMAKAVNQINAWLTSGISGVTVQKAKSWLKLLWWLAKQPATTSERMTEAGGIITIRAGVGENVTNITNYPITAYGNLQDVNNVFRDNKLFICDVIHSQNQAATMDRYYWDISVKKGMPVFFITVLKGSSNTAWVERLLSRTLTVYGEVVDLNAKNN